MSESSADIGERIKDLMKNKKTDFKEVSCTLWEAMVKKAYDIERLSDLLPENESLSILLEKAPGPKITHPTMPSDKLFILVPRLAICLATILKYEVKMKSIANSPGEHELQSVFADFDAFGVAIDKYITDLEMEYDKATFLDYSSLPPTPMSVQQVSESEGISPAKPPTKRARLTSVDKIRLFRGFKTSSKIRKDLMVYCVGQATTVLVPVRTSLEDLVRASDKTPGSGTIPACTQKVFDDESATVDPSDWKALRKHTRLVTTLFAKFSEASPTCGQTSRSLQRSALRRTICFCVKCVIGVGATARRSSGCAAAGRRQAGRF